MFNIGPQELLLVLIVALIIVGPKRLPDLGRTIGRGLNEFRKIQDEVKDMVKFDLGADPAETDDATTAPSFSDRHDADHVHDEGADDEVAFDGPEGDEGEGDPADDGMTHSERVIAAMSDDEDNGDEDVAAHAETGIERPAAIPVPDDEDVSSTDVPPAAAAE